MAVKREMVDVRWNCKMKRKHHDLQVWQLGMALVKEIYAMTRQFPINKLFAMLSALMNVTRKKLTAHS